MGRGGGRVLFVTKCGGWTTEKGTVREVRPNNSQSDGVAGDVVVALAHTFNVPE